MLGPVSGMSDSKPGLKILPGSFAESGPEVSAVGAENREIYGRDNTLYLRIRWGSGIFGLFLQPLFGQLDVIEGNDINSDVCDKNTFGGAGALRLVIDNLFESAKDVFPCLS